MRPFQNPIYPSLITNDEQLTQLDSLITHSALGSKPSIYMALPPKIRDLINQLARACETQRNVDLYSKPPSLLEDLPIQIPPPLNPVFTTHLFIPNTYSILCFCIIK